MLLIKIFILERLDLIEFIALANSNNEIIFRL